MPIECCSHFARQPGSFARQAFLFQQPVRMKSGPPPPCLCPFRQDRQGYYTLPVRRIGDCGRGGF